MKRKGADVGQLEAMSALNFLDLDDIPVLEEGELIDPLSIVTLPTINQRPGLPRFERSPTDPFFATVGRLPEEMDHHYR